MLRGNTKRRRGAAIQQHDRRCREEKQQAEASLQEAQEEYEVVAGRLNEQYAQAVREAAQKLYDFKGKIDERRDEIHALQAQAERLLRRRRCRRAARRLPEKQGVCRSTDALAEYATHVATAQQALAGFSHHAAARFLGSGSLIAILLLSAIAAVLAGVPGGFMDSMPGAWLIVSGALSFGLTAIVYAGVRPHVVRQTLAQYEQVQQALASAERSLQVATSMAKAEGDNRRLACKKETDLELRRRKKAITSGAPRSSPNAITGSRNRRTARKRNGNRLPKTASGSRSKSTSWPITGSGSWKHSINGTWNGWKNGSSRTWPPAAKLTSAPGSG